MSLATNGSREKLLHPKQIIFALLRVSMGFIFLWSFLDKVFGLGYTTCRNVETNIVEGMCDQAWYSGGSPTSGFLQFGTSGPFAEFFQSLAGNAAVDWLFMAGLLGIGVALILGIMMRVAVWSGVIMMILLYAATFPPEHNPVISEHVIYALVLLSFLVMPVGRWWGLEKRR